MGVGDLRGRIELPAGDLFMLIHELTLRGVLSFDPKSAPD